MRAAYRDGFASSGGESGLDLFIDDVKKIQVVEPPPLPQLSFHMSWNAFPIQQPARRRSRMPTNISMNSRSSNTRRVASGQHWSELSSLPLR